MKLRLIFLLSSQIVTHALCEQTIKIVASSSCYCFSLFLINKTIIFNLKHSFFQTDFQQTYAYVKFMKKNYLQYKIRLTRVYYNKTKRALNLHVNIL